MKDRQFMHIKFHDKTTNQKFNGFGDQAFCDEVFNRNRMKEYGGDGHCVDIQFYAGPLDESYVRERKQKDRSLKIAYGRQAVKS